MPATAELRFRRSSGAVRTIVVLERETTALVTRRVTRVGPDDDREPEITRASFRTRVEAQARLEADAAALLGDGFSLVQEPGASALSGVSVAHPELAAVIAAAPDEVENYRVYADWLSEQGDVRGELIRAELALERDPEDATSQRARDQIVKRFQRELFGPLAKFTVVRDPDEYRAGFRFHRGLFRAVRLWRMSHASALDVQLGWLFDNPGACALRHLVLGRSFWGDGARYERALAVIRERAPTTLTSLFLGENLDAVVGDVTPALAIPSLRRLHVDNPSTDLSAVASDRLTELVLDIASPDPAFVEGWEESDLPALRRISLYAWALDGFVRRRGAYPQLEALVVRARPTVAAPGAFRGLAHVAIEVLRIKDVTPLAAALGEVPSVEVRVSMLQSDDLTWLAHTLPNARVVRSRPARDLLEAELGT